MTDLSQTHQKIKEQVLDISIKYQHTLSTIIPVLKKSLSVIKKNDSDFFVYESSLNEANDHLSNLKQLQIEINNLDSSDNHLVLEISGEVIGNTLHFLNNLTNILKETSIASDISTTTDEETNL